MKKMAAMAVFLICSLGTSAANAGAGVSIDIGQPGFYGRLDIGNYPHPQVISPRPIIVRPGYGRHEPIYLRVPPGHVKHWKRYCHAITRAVSVSCSFGMTGTAKSMRLGIENIIAASMAGIIAIIIGMSGKYGTLLGCRNNRRCRISERLLFISLACRSAYSSSASCSWYSRNAASMVSRWSMSSKQSSGSSLTSSPIRRA